MCGYWDCGRYHFIGVLWSRNIWNGIGYIFFRISNTVLKKTLKLRIKNDYSNRQRKISNNWYCVEHAISKFSNLENLNSTNTKFLQQYDRKQTAFEKNTDESISFSTYTDIVMETFLLYFWQRINYFRSNEIIWKITNTKHQHLRSRAIYSIENIRRQPKLNKCQMFIGKRFGDVIHITLNKLSAIFHSFEFVYSKARERKLHKIVSQIRAIFNGKLLNQNCVLTL